MSALRESDGAAGPQDAGRGFDPGRDALASVGAVLAPGQTTVPTVVAVAPARRGCVTCGGEVPSWETECAFCVQAKAAGATSGWTLLAHWAVFTLAMLVVFGVGWLLSP